MNDDPLHLLVDAVRAANPTMALSDAVQAVEMPLARAVEASLATVNAKLDQMTLRGNPSAQRLAAEIQTLVEDASTATGARQRGGLAIADAIRLAEQCAKGPLDGFTATSDGLVLCWQTTPEGWTVVVDRSDVTVSGTTSEDRTSEELVAQFRADRDARRAAAGA